MRFLLAMGLGFLFWPAAAGADAREERLERIKYNHPGLTVDLGVGLWAWPLPMDYDQDGDLDLVVTCPDKPYNGTYFFENRVGRVAMPVFEPAVKIGPGPRNVQVSYPNGEPRVMTPGVEYSDFRGKNFTSPRKLSVENSVHQGRLRANQWKYGDYDGDGCTDLIVGVGDWEDYGWDNAFDQKGIWTRGPLRGLVYLLRNKSDDVKPEYAEPIAIESAGRPIDVFGMPSPNLADFDRDGDLDLLCGEFVDRLTYFENVGTRREPEFAKGRVLPIRMDLCMIVPVAVDWDVDGDIDLVVGEEDGRVALVEHTGEVVDGLPQFLPPRHFQQRADCVKFGALATPVGFDWDGDGDEDLICGNTAGHVGFIENLDGTVPPKWAAPIYLEAGGERIRIMAGPNGSIQGPCEAKWGYTTLSVADWDHDGLPDVVANSIWGRVVWFRNVGTRAEPRLSPAAPIAVLWPGPIPKPAWNWWDPADRELATQWRTTPLVVDLNRDGLNDLVMLDHEGYLAWYERAHRNEDLLLLPGKRIFRSIGASAFDSGHRPADQEAGPLRLNVGRAGASGRRKLCMVDWDGDGRRDLIVNSRMNADFMRNVNEREHLIEFQDAGPLDGRKLGGHTTSPTTVDWDKNGKPDLVIGGEDGFLYWLPR